MTLSRANLYSFDDCSIINQCEVKILPAFVSSFGIDKLCSENFKKLKKLSGELDNKEIPKYRFIPSNVESNMIKATEKLISQHEITFLLDELKENILKQLEDLFKQIVKEYSIIEKADEFSSIQELFIKNERPLKRRGNIPEDDDCKILKALESFECEGIKYIITEDEHFWGYKDMILSELRITAIEEWRCDTII